MITIKKTHKFETEIKKSRFIALAAHTATIEEALDFIKKNSDPEATHNCWAYKISSQYRFNDDGEPGGSAGRPILSAIEGQGVDQTVVLVIRFFGGTKLGVGGLVRAYSGCAAECIKEASKTELFKWAERSFTAPFKIIGSIYPLIDKFEIIKLNESYTDKGVKFTLKIKESDLLLFGQNLKDTTSGACRIK